MKTKAEPIIADIDVGFESNVDVAVAASRDFGKLSFDFFAFAFAC